MSRQAKDCLIMCIYHLNHALFVDVHFQASDVRVEISFRHCPVENASGTLLDMNRSVKAINDSSETTLKLTTNSWFSLRFLRE
jgi:hypothetical protein